MLAASGRGYLIGHLRDEIGALTQCLLVGKHLDDIRLLNARLRKQIVVDAQRNGARYVQTTLVKQVIYTIDRTRRRILERQNAIFDAPLFHSVDHGVERGHENDIGIVEKLAACNVLIGALDTLHRHMRGSRKFGDLVDSGRHHAFRDLIKQQMLIGAAHFHHHAEQGRNEFLELIARKLGCLVDFRRLARLSSTGLARRALVSRHIGGDMHAAFEQLNNLRVNLIDTRTRNRKIDDRASCSFPARSLVHPRFQKQIIQSKRDRGLNDRHRAHNDTRIVAAMYRKALVRARLHINAVLSTRN